ncbi:hypothetical protein LB507_008555 [Fusarium sp. FIESC RH6]|nr:hypothetical protein LB507_008555 [Fusarium sp. FIESC RH6]
MLKRKRRRQDCLSPEMTQIANEYSNLDILPTVSGSVTQDSPVPAAQSLSIPPLSTSQSVIPHQDAVIQADNCNPLPWNSLPDMTGHSQELNTPSSAATTGEIISVGSSAESYEADVALDADLVGSRDPDGLDTTDSSPIANATSAWAEILEERESDGNRVPFYPGDERGPAFVIDVCKPGRSNSSNHAFVAMPSLESLAPEEIEYLRFKGCFSLPLHPLREALIKAYFHYVHPFEPVLDPEDFFNKYSKGHLSLLLLWNIFMCAASFIDDSVFAGNFYDSQLAFKHKAFQRAKITQTLYDADYEKNKTTLIQSVFLMGHFYADAEDRLGPWHWNGVAISLSHTIGLHMLAPPVRDGFQPLWRRVWWCIYYREVWLSMGQGRPMRISLDHCSTSMPGLFDTSLHCSPEYLHYLPEQLGRLLRMWLKLIEVTRIMGEILSTNYSMKSARPSRAAIKRDEEEIRANGFPEDHNDQSPVLASHLYQFRLHTQAAIIALYRPFLFETPYEVPASEQDSWNTFVKTKVRTAASHATQAVNSMMAEDLMKFAQTVTVLTIGPPIQVLLFEMMSSKSSYTQLAKHNLAVCLLALQEMRKSYISADAAYKLFNHARTMVEKSLREAEVISTGPAASPETRGIETTQWLDSSEDYGFASTGMLPALWAPFAGPVPDDFSADNS